ncbi:MAG: P27 family phage terminase small subunit [Oscillospiraceae bacterium]|nr:P27 family phage terminase small subunit [Oscillospiraceae bacterium]
MSKNQKPAELQGYEMPPVRDFLTETQRDGTTLCATDVYSETYSWLKARGCENTVSRQLIEQYAMSVSRWVHCEQIISKYGYIAKHPTTGAAMTSPYVTMSQAYMKQIISIRAEINRIVEDSRPKLIEGVVREVVYGE